MTQAYDIPGKTPHDRSRWRWVDRGTSGGYWQVDGTRNKGYNCTTFLMAWLFPDARPAVWGDANQHIETHEIEAELQRRGFTAGTSEACLPPTTGSCTVLFFPKDNGVRGPEPFHVEVYDPVHGDWVGKASAAHPIRRRQNPLDYPLDPEERAKTDYVFYCRKDYLPVPPVTDAEIHRDAKKVLPPTPSPPVPRPPPYSPTWLLRLWSIVFGVLLGLLAGWFLFAA